MENLKKWGMIFGALLVVLSILWGFFKPARTIETKTNSKSEITAWAKVESLQSDNMMLKISKTETEKKLAKESELNKNVNTHREYYPDGKLKSEDIIDLSKYVRKSDSAETTTSTVTVTASAKLDEQKKESGKDSKTEKETDKKDTQYNQTILYLGGGAILTDKLNGGLTGDLSTGALNAHAGFFFGSPNIYEGDIGYCILKF